MILLIYRRFIMSTYEKDVLNTGITNNKAMEKATSEKTEILNSSIRGDNLHRLINNPTQEGIDEG